MFEDFRGCDTASSNLASRVSLAVSDRAHARVRMALFKRCAGCQNSSYGVPAEYSVRTPCGTRSDDRGPARPGGDTLLAADGRVSMQCSPDVKAPSSTAYRGRNTAASTPSGVGGGRDQKKEKGKQKGWTAIRAYVMCCTADNEGRSTGRAGRLLLAREARKCM